MYWNVFWLKARYRAMLCRLRRLITNDPALREKLLYQRFWYEGAQSEVVWWREWLSSQEGRCWIASVGDPRCALQDAILGELVRTLGNHTVRIIDVGSGPITHLGYNYPGKKLDIAAVDPLADAYARMLRELKVKCPVQTRVGTGESLVHQFEHESFDIAYASNALDHSADPLLVIENMLALVRPDHYVVLRHYRNEGEVGAYHGLHQWNFDVERDDFIIWNTARRHNVSKMLREQADIKCWIADPRSHGIFDYSDWVVCVLKKRG